MKPVASYSTPMLTSEDSRRLPSKVDWYLLLATIILLTVGLMSIYSEGAGREGTLYFRKQLINIGVGLIPLSIFAFVNPKIWMRFANVLYVINCLALTSVLVVGKSVKGAGRWIMIGPVQFQPSEMAKILVLITLATYFAKRLESIDKTSTFFLSFLHVAVPMGLILMQPHLGAATVLFVGWLAISVAVGVPWAKIGVALGALVLLAAMLFAVPPVRNKLLRPYQTERILAFMHIWHKASDDSGQSKAQKQEDRDREFQSNQARVAFSAGGVTGTGFLKGEQKRTGYIAEQHNDFIFTVPGEEAGFIGCTLVLAAFGFFFYRVWLIMVNASEPFNRMVAGGIFAVLGIHMFANIAMVLQLAPVVGLWLPFLSYGGTAMWLCLSCVGLLLNLRRSERPLLF